MKQLVFIEEMSGISKRDKPYHLLKVADPETFENHTISYDSIAIPKSVFAELRKGQKIVLDGDLSTPYGNTQFFATSIKKVN